MIKWVELDITRHSWQISYHSRNNIWHDLHKNWRFRHDFYV